jgi:hypothetical protein
MVFCGFGDFPVIAVESCDPAKATVERHTCVGLGVASLRRGANFPDLFHATVRRRRGSDGRRGGSARDRLGATKSQQGCHAG